MDSKKSVEKSNMHKQHLRHEYKYICSSGQMTMEKVRISGLLQLDRHAISKGYYRIRSLYFDTPEDQCFYDNEGGFADRSKYRIRIYDGNKERITLEKKVKNGQMGYKLSCTLTEEECRYLMRAEYQKVLWSDEAQEPIEQKEPIKQQASIEHQGPSKQKESIKQQLIREMQLALMKPKVIVEYKRYPFVEAVTNVRVTFDEDISSSNDIDHFLDKQIALRPINPLGNGILEVKWDEILPDYIRKTLQLHDLTWTGYSKYYYCRKFNLYGGVRV